jgi:hypothetical protein
MKKCIIICIYSFKELNNKFCVNTAPVFLKNSINSSFQGHGSGGDSHSNNFVDLDSDTESGSRIRMGQENEVHFFIIITKRFVVDLDPHPHLIRIQ